LKQRTTLSPNAHAPADHALIQSFNKQCPRLS
jgi:hypothetical protein